MERPEGAECGEVPGVSGEQRVGDVLLAILDEAVQFAAAHELLSARLLTAKRAYIEATGEVFEEEALFEPRLIAFLEQFLFEERLDEGVAPGLEVGATPMAFYLSTRPALARENPALAEGLLRSRHTLWEVKKLKRSILRLRDLLGGGDLEIEEGIPLGLEKGTLVEARLVPTGDDWHFTRALAFHPMAARKTILARLKQLKKSSGGVLRVDALLASLARCRLKLERYRKVPPKRIYAELSDAEPEHAAAK